MGLQHHCVVIYVFVSTEEGELYQALHFNGIEYIHNW
jgi:hypothetical protein